MDVQLKELIDKIKDDAVKSAEDNAARIIAEAEEKAEAIVKNARTEAETLRETAKADAEKAERSGREAIRQAGRNLVLTLKGEIEALFGKVLTGETGAILKGELMAGAVESAVKALSEGDKGEVDVLLPESSFAELEAGLRGKLSEKMGEGLEIKPFKGLDAGFRISMKDGTAFYDFSEAEIAAMLGRYLNPRLSELLSE
jgi:V/A-type H+/Na+-transporting ATPase subunit E